MFGAKSIWYRKVDLLMFNKTFLNVMCVARAAGESDKYTTSKRKYENR